MIKLIALDLDGTLLNPDKKISEANKLAIHRHFHVFDFASITNDNYV